MTQIERYIFRIAFGAFLACLVGLALSSTTHALAAGVGALSTNPDPAVSSGVLAWASMTALACTFILGLATPGNPCPVNLNPMTRFWVATVVTVISGAAHSLQTGVTLQTAILTALSSLLMAVIAHFSTPGSMAKVSAEVVK